MTKIDFVVGDMYEFDGVYKRKLVYIGSRSGEMVFEGGMGCLYITSATGTESMAHEGNVTRRIPPKVVRYAVMDNESVVTFFTTEAQAKGYVNCYGCSTTRIVKLIEDTNQ